MKVSIQSTLRAPLESARASLADVDAVLDAMPGATLSRDGSGVTGSLKCKLGSTQITYRLTAVAEAVEAAAEDVVLAVTGKEARGTGTLVATLAISTRADGDDTAVEVSGEIEATGRGEQAGMAAWAQVIETLVAAVPLPARDNLAPVPAESDPAALAPISEPPEPTPEPTAAPAPSVEPSAAPARGPVRPPLSVAPEAAAPISAPPGAQKKKIAVGMLALVVLLLIRRSRRHREPPAPPSA